METNCIIVIVIFQNDLIKQLLVSYVINAIVTD